ncbi:MAG: hypothetical protein V1779_01880 [bacterium]
MLNRKILNIIGIILILTLLPATSGVAIFHHICNVEGTHNVSLYTETKCDHHEETTGVCEHCLKDTKSCTVEGQSHCIEYVEFLSIDADFLTSTKLFLQPVEFDLPIREQFDSYSQEILEENIKQDYFKKDIKKPVFSEISFIKFKSQYKSSEKSSDYFIS